MKFSKLLIVGVIMSIPLWSATPVLAGNPDTLATPLLSYDKPTSDGPPGDPPGCHTKRKGNLPKKCNASPTEL